MLCMAQEDRLVSGQAMGVGGGVRMDGLTDTGLIGDGADTPGRDLALALGALTTKKRLE